MKNMKMSAKLITGFTIVIALAAIVGATGIVGMTITQQGAADLYNYNLMAVSAMADLREIFAAERSDMRNILLSADNPAAVKQSKDAIAANDKKAADAFIVYEKTIVDMADETDYFTAKETFNVQFADLKAEVMALVDRGEVEEAKEKYLAGSAIVAPIVNGLAGSTKYNSDFALSQNTANDQIYRTLIIVLSGVLLLAVIIAVSMAFYLSGLISKPIISMAEAFKQMGLRGNIYLPEDEKAKAREWAMRKDEIGECCKAALGLIEHLLEVDDDLKRIAGGDLSVEADLLSENDTIGQSLKKMLESMNSIFGDIHASAAQVSSGSKQIANGAQALAQGSTEQASAVEQLSSSMSRIAEKTQHSAVIAGEAATLSTTIRSNAEKGSVQMDQLMRAVREINEASTQIEQVIKVIDELAFQTNILALNASVEAARAGQHGKGFAVVAEEVGNLAAKSGQAAKDTGGLIVNSIAKANLGLTMATETSASLKEIVEGINHSAEIVAQIAQSSDEQSAAITQINTGIEQVAQVVQQNSATAQQSAAASEEMSGQSDMLEQLIAQFKLKDEPNHAISSGTRKKGIPASGRNAFPASGSEAGFGKY